MDPLIVNHTNLDCVLEFLAMLLPLVLLAVLITLSVALRKEAERRRLQDPTRDMIRRKHR